MIVISDTSPIINLAIIGHLHLLPAVFKEVVIPTAVYNEITLTGVGLPGSVEIAAANWVSVVSVKNRGLVDSFRGELQIGESEAIVLAMELKADLVLIDEALGRSIASKNGLKIMGLLGVLIIAKQKGLIPAVKPLIGRLQAEADFWISHHLINQVLAEAGEIFG